MQTFVDRLIQSQTARKGTCSLFTDDFCRKIGVYFLVEKSEAFAVFKSFKTYVEKETSSFLRCLRTDRGGEFTS